MAHCVITAIVDTEDPALPVAPACMVHTHFAPCPRDGAPACPVPLHALPGFMTRAEALRMWQIRVHRQRPLVIHRQDGRDAGEHDDGDGAECACGPEVLAAEGG